MRQRRRRGWWIALVLLVAAAACGDAADPGPAPVPEAYRYTAVLEATVQGLLADQQFSTTKIGEFRAPDAHAVEVVTAFDGVAQPTQRVTVIGSDAWLDDGSGGLPVALPASDRRVRAVVADFTSVDDNLLPDAAVVAVITAGDGQEEEIDGTPVLRFADEDRGLDLWVRESDGAIVRVGLAAAGPAEILGPAAAAALSAGADIEFTVTVDITDIDDPGISIAAPAEFAPPPELVTFADPAGRFTIDHPPDWSGVAGGDEALLLVSPLGDTATFTVTVEPEPTTPDVFGARVREEITADADVVVANDRPVDFPFGTADALELERTSAEREVLVLFVSGDVGYRLSFQGTDPGFSELIDTLGQILRTFSPSG